MSFVLSTTITAKFGRNKEHKKSLRRCTVVFLFIDFV